MGLFDFFKSKPTNSHLPQHPVNNLYADNYFKNMEQIEVMWSVLQNLKGFTTPQASALENLCTKNITEYKLYINTYDGAEPPHHAPAYVRLAMLYEKQNRFEDGINICVDAIKNGAYEDGSKGKMYGRLARLIKKSGIEVSPDILKLTQEG